MRANVLHVWIPFYGVELCTLHFMTSPHGVGWNPTIENAMPYTRQRGGLVWLQNTPQQIRLYIVLLFWCKTDLRSDRRAFKMPLDPLDSEWLALIYHL